MSRIAARSTSLWGALDHFASLLKNPGVDAGVPTNVRLTLFRRRPDLKQMSSSIADACSSATMQVVSDVPNNFVCSTDTTINSSSKNWQST